MALMKNFGLAGINANTQWGKGGGRLKWTTDHFEVLDAAGTAPVQLRVATTPVENTDAASKAYVDSIAAGLDPKASVRAATTVALAGATYGDGTAGVGATLTATGIGTGAVVDGVTLAGGDRVLIKNQADPAENGVYVVTDADTLTRSSDFDGSPAQEVDGGEYVFVEEGTANADTGWVNSSNYATTAAIGTDEIVFVQFSSAGVVEAGNGLTKTGNVLAVGGSAGRISVTADAIDIDAAYVGQASITTVGTITTGAWDATTIATTAGGTGLEVIGTSKQVLRTNTAGTALEYADLIAGDIKVTNAAFLIDADGAGPGETETVTDLNTVLTRINDRLAASSGDIQDELDLTQTTLGLEADGTKAAWAANNHLTNEATFKAAIEKLDDVLFDATTHQTSAEAALGLNADGTLVAWATTGSLAVDDTFAEAIGKLDTDLTAASDKVDAVQESLGLDANGDLVPWATTGSLAADDTFAEAIGKLDAALDSLSQTEIKDTTDGNTYVRTEVGGSAEQIHFGVNGDIIAKMIEGASGTDESFTFTKATGEVRIEAHGTPTDIDIRLVPQGGGQVFIGDTGDGVIQADNGSKLTLAGGDNTASGNGGNLVLRGGNGAGTDGVVQILDATENEVMEFRGVASATNYFVATNAATAGAVILASAGDADTNIELAPAGEGLVLAKTGYDMSEGSALAFATKGYVDDVAGDLTTLEGALRTNMLSADNATAAGGDQILVGTSVGTPVNYATVTNAAANGNIIFGAAGNDADIDLVLSPKGTGLILAPTGYSDALVALGGSASEDAFSTKGYVDAAIASAQTSGAVGGIRAVQVAFTGTDVDADGFAIGAPVTGRVMRVRVAIDGALGGPVTIGAAGNVTQLATADYIDEAAVGIYVIDVNQNYATATQLVIAGTPGTGTGHVTIEYISA